jgi:hypothetical protein
MYDIMIKSKDSLHIVTTGKKKTADDSMTSFLILYKNKGAEVLRSILFSIEYSHQ